MAIFFVDFDDTLFETNKFKEFISEQLNLSDLLEMHHEFIGTRNASDFEANQEQGFFLKNFLKFLKEKKKIKKNFDEKIFCEIVEDKLPHLVSEETIEALKMTKLGNRLVMVSAGNEEFQNLKIKGSGLADYFDEIIISDGQKGRDIFDHLARETKGEHVDLFFIDDKPLMLERVKHSFEKQNEKINLVRIADEVDNNYFTAPTFAKAILDLNKTFRFL